MKTDPFLKLDSSVENASQSIKKMYSFNEKRFKKNVIVLVGKAEVNEAIDELIKATSYGTNKKFKKELIGLKSRWNSNEERRRNNKIKESDYTVEKNKIVNSTLTINDEIILPKKNRFFFYLKIVGIPILIYLVYMLSQLLFPPTFTFYGNIIHDNGVPVEGVKIWIDDQDKFETTNSKGEFTFRFSEKYANEIIVQFWNGEETCFLPVENLRSWKKNIQKTLIYHPCDSNLE